MVWANGINSIFDFFSTKFWDHKLVLVLKENFAVIHMSSVVLFKKETISPSPTPASIEVDLRTMKVGQNMVVKFMGKPLFVKKRTPEQITQSQADDAYSIISMIFVCVFFPARF